MTMGKAVLFMVLSIFVMVAGILAVAFKVNSGIVNGEIDSQSSGARTGSQAATPVGAATRAASGNAGATITAAVQFGTTVAKTAAALTTPGPGSTRTPATPAVAAVGIGQPIEVGGSRYTVYQVADPEPPGIFTTTAGNRRVALEVSQEALSGTVQYTFAQFKIRDTSGTDYTWAITNSKPGFEQGTLTPGQAKQGWISFQVPVGVQLDALVLQIPGQAATTPLVKLR
jgi:hypothetical protein